MKKVILLLYMITFYSLRISVAQIPTITTHSKPDWPEQHRNCDKLSIGMNNLINKAIKSVYPLVITDSKLIDLKENLLFSSQVNYLLKSKSLSLHQRDIVNFLEDLQFHLKELDRKAGLIALHIENSYEWPKVLDKIEDLEVLCPINDCEYFKWYNHYLFLKDFHEEEAIFPYLANHYEYANQSKILSLLTQQEFDFSIQNKNGITKEEYFQYYIQLGFIDFMKTYKKEKLIKTDIFDVENYIIKNASSIAVEIRQTVSSIPEFTKKLDIVIDSLKVIYYDNEKRINTIAIKLIQEKKDEINRLEPLIIAIENQTSNAFRILKEVNTENSENSMSISKLVNQSTENSIQVLTLLKQANEKEIQLALQEKNYNDINQKLKIILESCTGGDLEFDCGTNNDDFQKLTFSLDKILSRIIFLDKEVQQIRDKVDDIELETIQSSIKLNILEIKQLDLKNSLSEARIFYDRLTKDTTDELVQLKKSLLKNKLDLKFLTIYFKPPPVDELKIKITTFENNLNILYFNRLPIDDFSPEIKQIINKLNSESYYINQIKD